MTEYKVGDRGVTWDGREAECIEDREDMSHPLRWESIDQRWSTARNGISSRSTHFDIVRRLDDAKVEPAADEVANDEPPAPSTIRTSARFESDEHVIGGVHLIASCGQGKVSLHIDDKELSEAEAAAVMRTIETVMEQARRAKEVGGE